ncbi:hypothetical protein CRENBAI_000903 [Crenichthys baileyi]|uniref:Uncharacterized protein n=1 Tax=Crenichthys baileyi TaxID=28760 RepID=A0AAV9RVT1_9TELE
MNPQDLMDCLGNLHEEMTEPPGGKRDVPSGSTGLKKTEEVSNPSCYSSSLWEYMFSSTAPGLSSDSESEGVEAEDDSDCITLKNIPSLQLSSTQDEDDEESFGLAAEELERKISEAIAITTFEENRNREMEKIRNFDCKCYGRRKENSLLGTQSCSRKLSPELMYNILMDSLAAEREWQDMRIIGHLEANRRKLETSAMTTSTKKTPRKRKHARTTYSIRGIEFCRNTFQFQ